VTIIVSDGRDEVATAVSTAESVAVDETADAE